MIVNRANLDILFTGFKTAFRDGLGQAEAQWMRVATRVNSTTREEKYGWLGKIPGLRKWVGDRVINNLMQHDYAIRNEDYEDTIGVDENEINDDTYGTYGPMFQELGLAVAAQPNLLVYGLLKAGFDASLGLAYDGQYFFDTDHPVLDANGNVTSVANTDGGSGVPWFLIDDSRALKPILYQVRKEGELVRKDRPDDDNVFFQRQLIYGVHHRCNVGFGFWQYAWGSKQTLNAANYKGARAAMRNLKGDYGRPLGIRPRLLVVPPDLEEVGLEILNAERDASGATNVWRGTAELLVADWLA